MFKGPEGFGQFINAVMNIVIGLLVALALFALQGAPITFDAVLQSLVLSFCVGYTFGNILPIMSWGQALARALHCSGLTEYLVTAVVLGFCMAVAITFVVAFINIFTVAGMGAVLGFFIQFVPIVIAIAVAVVVVLLKPTMGLAAKVSGFNPAAIPQQ